MFLRDVEPIAAVPRADYERAADALRIELLTLQHRLLTTRPFSVIIKVAGFDRYGRHACMDVLHEWMDPRYLGASAFGPRSTEAQRLHPWFWRFWQVLPPRGEIGILARAWTEGIIFDRLNRRITRKRMARRLAHVRALEQMLVADGALIVKVWLHLSRRELKKKVREDRRDPLQAWRITAEDMSIARDYQKCRKVAEHVLEATHQDASPWHVIDSTHARSRNLAFGRLLRDRLQKHLDAPAHTEAEGGPGAAPVVVRNALARVDLSSTLDYDDYTRKRKRLQAKLARLTREAHMAGISTVLAFEGWDAAGKGGIIRRLIRAIDASVVRVVPIAAPSEQEKLYNHLWRFWQRLPRDGNVTLFDRTWYGRVLVEKLEGFAPEPDWGRAYEEINDFESQLADHGTVVLKFWVHIDPDEQLRRFHEREKIPFKQFKITDEDYRNRERWSDYETAVNEMVARTNTPHAPWHLIPANDKRFARIRVLQLVTRRLARALSEVRGA